jgi:hypothetical protein
VSRNRKRFIFAAASVFFVLMRAASWAQTAFPLTAEELQAIRIATVDPSNHAVPMDSRLVELLKLGTSETVTPIRQRIRVQPDGKYFVSFSLRPGSDDVVFSVQKRGISWFYRTDSTRLLRAAAVLDSSGARPVPIGDANESYKAALRVWSELLHNILEQ